MGEAPDQVHISAMKAPINTKGKPKIRMSRVCAAKATSTSSRPLCNTAVLRKTAAAHRVAEYRIQRAR